MSQIHRLVRLGALLLLAAPPTLAAQAPASPGAPYAIAVRRLGSAGFEGRRGRAAFLAMLPPGGMTFPAADVVKVYPDGREEPLRNASVLGITPASFKEIVAASRVRTAVTTPSGGPMGMAMLGMVNIGVTAHAMFAHASTYVVPSLLFEDVSLRAPGGDGIRPPVISPPWTPQR